MTSPAALPLFSSFSPAPFLNPPPLPPRPSHLHSSASVSQMGILTCTHLIEAGQTPSFLPLPSVSLLSQGQNAKSTLSVLYNPSRQDVVATHIRAVRTENPGHIILSAGKLRSFH